MFGCSHSEPKVLSTFVLICIAYQIAAKNYKFPR